MSWRSNHPLKTPPSVKVTHASSERAEVVVSGAQVGETALACDWTIGMRRGERSFDLKVAVPLQQRIRHEMT